MIQAEAVTNGVGFSMISYLCFMSSSELVGRFCSLKIYLRYLRRLEILIRFLCCSAKVSLPSNVLTAVVVYGEETVVAFGTSPTYVELTLFDFFTGRLVDDNC